MYRKTMYMYHKENYESYVNMQQNEEIPVIHLGGLQYNIVDEKNDRFDLNLTSALEAITLKTLPKLAIENNLYELIEAQNNPNICFVCEISLQGMVKEQFSSFFDDFEVIELPNDKVEKGTLKTAEAKIKNKIVNFSKTEINKLEKTINHTLIGHSEFKKRIREEIEIFNFFYQKIGDMPVMSLFLLGPSGVGKTEIARIIHSALDSAEFHSPLAKINFANYKNESSLASLIGSPPGYQDSEKDSDLVQKINKSVSGVLLVDEFEKADAAAHNFFLQLLEEGRFDTANGRVYDLSGYIIIFTSNLDENTYLERIPPELQSRFNMVTVFEHLRYQDKLLFAENILDKYKKRSGKRLSKEKRKEIIENLNLEEGNNLRNIQKKMRRSFYMATKK